MCQVTWVQRRIARRRHVKGREILAKVNILSHVPFHRLVDAVKTEIFATTMLILLPSYLVLNAYHIDLNIDTIVTAMLGVFTAVTSFKPRFRTQGGTAAEGLSLQNIQSRLR